MSLSNHYLVITPDLRGHGLSPVTEGIYEMELMARDVLELLDQLHISKAVIMGHSMGGYVALEAFMQRPSYFLGLGLIGSQASGDSMETAKNRQKSAEKVQLQGSKAIAEAMLPKFFIPGQPSISQMQEFVSQIVLDTSPISIISSLQGMASRSDFSDQLAKLDLPVLILSGEMDQMIPVANASKMASKIRGATLSIIPKSGHLPMLDCPDATTKAIGEFLSTIPFGNQLAKVLPPKNDGTASYS